MCKKLRECARSWESITNMRNHGKLGERVITYGIVEWDRKSEKVFKCFCWGGRGVKANPSTVSPLSKRDQKVGIGICGPLHTFKFEKRLVCLIYLKLESGEGYYHRNFIIYVPPQITSHCGLQYHHRICKRQILSSHFALSHKHLFRATHIDCKHDPTNQ